MEFGTFVRLSGGVCALVLAMYGATQFTLWRYVGPANPRFMHSSTGDVTEALKLARVERGELVVDLGCGDGRAVIIAARDFGARGLCVEINADLLMDARANARLSGVFGQIEFVRGDLFEASIADADVIFLYLTPEFNAKLAPKLRAEMKPGARVVTLAHPMPASFGEPDRLLNWDDERGRARVLYVHVVPGGGA